MLYRIRERIAYSTPGKFVASAARCLLFKNARSHWVQQAFADWSLQPLKGSR